MKKISVLYTLSILLIFNFTVTAQNKVKISDQKIYLNGKKYYLHKVETGQTLYSVSKAYKVDAEDIKIINHLNSDNIKSGQLLKIPYKEISEKQEDDSPDFFYHKVAKGETLFSLSQKYYVEIEEIIETNPEVKYGLKAGQIIKIPNAFKRERNERNERNEEYFIYTVEKGNTLYSISKKYEISTDELIKLNPEAEYGIKTGQKLKIPASCLNNKIENTESDSPDNKLNKGLNDPNYFTEPGITPCTNFEYSKDKIFNVVMLLPLFTEKNLYYISRYTKEKDPMFYKNTKRFTEFYEGALLALNKLRKQGLSLNIKIYDTENNPDKVENILNSLDFPNIDLIIGPVYSKNVKTTAEIAEKNKVNIISPLSSRDTLLFQNPFLFQATPSKKADIKKISEYLQYKKDSINLILIHNGTDQQKKSINTLKKYYTANDTLGILSDTSVLKIFKYDADIKMMDEMQEKINKALKQGYKNYVFIPSNNEVFVTQIIDKFYAAKQKNERENKTGKNLDIIIAGSKKWLNFQNINADYFKKLDFIFTAPKYINYDSRKTKEFIREYRTAYKTEPSEYSFSGYDITYYFINALRKYGRIFQFCLSPDDAFPENRGLAYKFYFERTGLYNGFENKNTFILKLNENFKLINAFSEQ